MQCLTEGCQRFSKIVKVNKNEASVSLTTALFIKHWPTMEGYCNLYERQSSSATQLNRIAVCLGELHAPLSAILLAFD